jgi:hypothetical protein
MVSTDSVRRSAGVSIAILLVPLFQPTIPIPVSESRSATKSGYDHPLPPSRVPRGVVTTSTSPSVFTPAGGVLSTRAQYGIAMTGTIPMPSETTHTNVNARAFAATGRHTPDHARYR